MSPESVISVDRISKVYRSGWLQRRRRQALAQVSLEVPRGQVFGLLGPNGAGKTTLIKVLLGIVRPTSGQAHVLGFPAGSRRARQQIGYLPENHRIPRHLTGHTALEYYGALNGLALSDIRQRREALLQTVGLQGRGRDRVAGYSKGMLQRLGLAQAMLHEPELIILDEPTDGVDPVGRREIRDVLRQLAEQGTTVFLNSHLLQEIELVCDSVAILTDGCVRRTGTVRDLKQVLCDPRVFLQLTGDAAAVRQLLEQREGFQLRPIADSAFEVEVRIGSQPDLDQLVDQLRAAGISIWRLARREPTLEEAFLQIVGENA